MSNTRPPRDDNATRKFNAQRALRNCGDISGGLKCTAEVILDHVTSSSRYRVAWPSIARISHISGASVRSIGDHIYILEGLGIFDVRKMGLREFREYAREEFGLDVKPEHTGGSKHYMNLYVPAWSHGVFQLADRGRGVRGGSLSPEGKELLRRLRLEVASGRAGRPSNTAGAAASNTAGAAASNTAGAADNLRRGEGRRAPLSHGAGESDLVPPAAAPGPDQTEIPPPGDGGGVASRGATGRRATSHRPVNPPLPVGVLPANDPAGFERFLGRWENLSRSLPTWLPMDAPGRVAWAGEWDRSEALRGAADLVLDEAGSNPFLTGLKEGEKGAFVMQPNYLLKADAKSGHARYLLLATRSPPFYDYREPIDLRVKLLLRDHPADAASLVDTCPDFYPHERPRAAELLGETARDRALAASAKAEKDARASLLSAGLEDVRHRLGTLSAMHFGEAIDYLPEYVKGLMSCPAAGGKELIAAALHHLVSYYNQWRQVDYSGDLRATLLALDSPQAVALREGLDERFPPAEDFMDILGIGV